MKQFEVKALGLEEMSLQEARATDGGIPPFFGWLIGAIVTVVRYSYENWDTIQQASNDAKNDFAEDNVR